MTYLERSLAPGEEIVCEGRWPMIYWVMAWAALLLLGIFVVGVLIFARAAIHMSVTQFGVTSQRVVIKHGWLNVRTQEIATMSVEGVSVVQSFWGKLFGYGRIMVTGTGEAHLVFPPMANPVAFRRAIESARIAHDEHEVHLAEEDREVIREAAENGAREDDAPPPRANAQ